MELKIKEIKQLFSDFIIDNITLPFNDRYLLYIDSNSKNIDTAYWFYKPPHNIVIGKNVLKNMKKNFDDYKKYILSYIKHEVSHSLLTTKLDETVEILNELKIPFHYLNLFEDARIEHLYRKETDDFFNWSNFEELDLENKTKKEILSQITPLSIYFYFIYSENELMKKNINNLYIKTIINHKFYKDIKSYYLRSIECEETIKLLPIIKEFYKKYNNNVDNQIPKIPIKINMDLEEKDIEGIKFISSANINENNKSIFGEIEEKTLDEIKLEEKKLDIVNILENSSNNENFFNKRIMYSDKEVKEIITESENIVTTSLKKIFKNREISTIKENASKIIEPNRLVLDMEEIFIHKKSKNKGKRKKPKKLTLIVDASGSMQIINKKVITIMYIFNRLYQYKVIDLDIILSAGFYKSLYFKLNLPLKSEEILKLQFRGASEALNNTFVENKKIIQKSDIVFVLTDGMIVDKPINKTELNKQGIYTRAIYISNKTNTKKYEQYLLKYFDEYIIKENIQNIFEEIILKLR